MSGKANKIRSVSDINEHSSLDTYQTPRGDIPYTTDSNDVKIAPVGQILTILGSKWFDVLSNDQKDAAAISHFGDRVNEVRDVRADDAIEHVIHIDANSSEFEVIDELRKRKTSQYGDTSWEESRDGDKDQSELDYNHISGYLAEYAVKILAIKNGWDIKQVQEIKDESDTNQADLIANGTDIIDVKTVREGKGANHPWVKWSSNQYLNKNGYQRRVDNKHADYGLHAYIQSVKDGDKVSKSELENGDVTVEDIDSFYIGLEMVIDYNEIKNHIQNNDKGIFANNQLTLPDDGVVFYKRAPIYDNNWYSNINEFFSD
jgi:hypothetical protein